LKRMGILCTYRQKIVILDEPTLSQMSRNLVGEKDFNYF